MRIYRSRFRSITPTKASSGPSGCGRWLAPLQLASAMLLLVSTGCTALTNPIHGVPANRLPSQLFAKPKNNLVPIDISLLTLEPPRSYQLDSGDILGIYVEGVMPFVPLDKPPEPPPVNFPDASSLLPPSIGYPIPVAEDGTLSLPLLSPLNVRGLTLDQVREAIRQAYIEREIMPADKARPVVTLIQERTYNVIVVRQDNVSSNLNGEIRGSSDESSSGKLVKLPAYQNDILHALVQTGGLPGLKAKNEVQVLRSSKADKIKRAQFVSEFYRHQAAAQCDPCACPPELPADPSILRIPLRLPPGVVPSLSNDDIRLEDGDIVYIESRETEVFYTGGLLPGGEHMLPRDYDLDVLGAIAITGGNIGGTSGNGGGGGGMRGGIGGFGGVPPGQLYILRETECDGQVIIEVDLNKAIMNPRSRPLIQAGDVLILQYKCEEEIVNFGLGTFFTYGIQEMLRN
ncbi:Polysaccharide biosynthesis/export protein [Roseimaritima multifibrata]|uniref:Polysaccharide biosynthesis/export protein n=2 Tax=Roseimaritima multifibrata TaxID=1930274 RepID=A0A517MPB9_9BACT|nr:polysaccharide biosynthesis/export family protein [Roseimaritima multifibrata]QDS96722.1 Polysaccharide biosynthesis/export protein [Roseimaritima multifibrata]